MAIISISAVVALALIVIAIMQFVQYRTRLNSISPELAKAMTYDQVQDGEEVVDGTDGHVNFDAFFLRDLNSDGFAESIRGTSKRIGEEDTLYMEISVNTAGYLKDGKITIDNGNFYFQTALPKDDELKDNYVGNNTKVIEFNQLSNGTQKMLAGIVRSGDYSSNSKKNAAIENNINNYSKVNSVTLTGTYVTEDNQEIPITKTVNFDIDWYGTAKTEIPSSVAGGKNLNQEQDIKTTINEEEGTFTVKFTMGIQEANSELLLSKSHIEAEVPQLNGYSPTKVEVNGANVTYTYDNSSRKLEAERTSVIDGNKNITSQAYDGWYDNIRYNKFNVKITYPLKAYKELGSDTVVYKIPVNAYYEGYNNQSSEFTNLYKSNTAKATFVISIKNPTGTVARVEVTVGNSIYSPSFRYIVSKQKPLKIYNGTSDSEADDTYQVKWYVTTGTDGESTGLRIKETKDGEKQVSDSFVKTNSSEESMENITKFVGIAFSGADNLLKDNGWIKVYDDETDNLLVTFTKNDWNEYTSSNPYKYELPVKHIRVETSDTNASTYMYIYNIKELDDDYITTNYTREDFDDLQYIKSTLTGYLGENYINTDTHNANYEAPYSIADIGLSNNTISTQGTEKNEKLTITARYNTSYNQVGWVNGSFIIKLPEEIIDATINNVQINNSKVSLTSYELIEQDATKLIKINTQNSSDIPQTYSITVDIDLTPDPRGATMTKDVELYASNENVNDYYYHTSDIYDVNDNLNTEEQVNKTTASLSMISPNSLLTNQVASNYDEKGSQVVSPQVIDFKPSYAVLDQKDEQEVTIGVQLRNNYASTISDIQILGKIPFEGNTYVLSEENLGSNFTTKMVNTGIQLPSDLKQYATVYYSENEKPDRDLTNPQNEWKKSEQITNWDNVKTFLIDLGRYVMPTGAEYVFNYTVKIPNGLEFNQVAYSHHGVYFALDTDQGKYRTQIEPNRLGFRIAEKFNLELTKYHIRKDKLVSGATYSVIDEETGESKTAVTNDQGMLTISNLYVEKAYIIKEIKSPRDYELNQDSIRFIGRVDKNGNLTIEKTSGNTKEDMQATKIEGEDYKVTVKVEDEAKASIKIRKVELGTNIAIPQVKYKLTGYNLSTSGLTITTDLNGQSTINGLSVNQEYTLQETKAEGYYLSKDSITFKIVNDNGTYKLEITSGNVKEQSIIEEDSIPIANITLENEKKPTYTLQIVKQEKIFDTELTEDQTQVGQGTQTSAETKYLEGAKFKLYKGAEELGEYITDSTGTITINNLYQYIDGKDEDGIYTLKEVLAPNGYAKVKDITFKVQNIDGKLQLINIDGTEENYTVTGTTVRLTIEDSPSFRLVKKDADTQQPIANVKFAIYNVEDGEVPATNSKGEILGTLETINGKEYYTVTTNEKGEITIDLTEGLYKAVELEAPEQYKVVNQTYYFGVGASRETNEEIVPTWIETYGGEDSAVYFLSVDSSNDGGFIVGGYFAGTIKIGNEILTSDNINSLIIKYDSNYKVEWISNIDSVGIFSVSATSDGGYIAGGILEGTAQIKNKALTSNGEQDGIVIKYTAEGVIEWVNSFGGSDYDQVRTIVETSDGGYIAGGYFRSGSIQVGNETLTNGGSYSSDGIIIKYDAYGEVKWAKSYGGSDDDYIYSVAGTSDGGYIVGGYFESETIQVENEILERKGKKDAVIIKYTEGGYLDWIKTLGGSEVEVSDDIKAISTNDEGIVVRGTFRNGTIEIDGNIITNEDQYSDKGFFVKYNLEGEVKWIKETNEIGPITSTNDGGIISVEYSEGGVVQTEDEIYISTGGTKIVKYNREGKIDFVRELSGLGLAINSIEETQDEGFVITGYTPYRTQIGNEVINTKYGSGQYTAMICKFENQMLSNPSVTSQKTIGGTGEDEIKSLVSTQDGGFIAGGSFSETITLENELLKSKGKTDGILIKYDKNRQIEWKETFGGNSDDNIQSIVQTNDGGYVVGANFNSGEIQIGKDRILNVGTTEYSEALIIKYTSEGEVEWVKGIKGSNDDKICSIDETQDGGIIAVGYSNSTKIQVGNIFLTNNSYNTDYSDGIVVKFSAEGEVEWAKNIGAEYDEQIKSVSSTNDGGFLVGGNFSSYEIQIGNDTLINKSPVEYTDGLIIKYNINGEVEWTKQLEGYYSEDIPSIIGTSDGGFAVGINYVYMLEIEDETFLNIGDSSYNNSILVKYDSNGKKEWSRELVEGLIYNYDTQILELSETQDGGILVGGKFSSYRLSLGNEIIENDYHVILLGPSYNGMAVKYNKSGHVEWAKGIGGNSDDEIQSVVETKDGRVIASGYFSEENIDVDGSLLENKGVCDGFIFEITNKMGVPEIQELIVENNKKEFNITTEVKKENGVKYGSISGDGLSSYEMVKYGENNTKDIVIQPISDYYEIMKITVNGKEWPFKANSDGTYTMPKFENITEDKHIVVTFGISTLKIKINKVDSETGEKLKGAVLQVKSGDYVYVEETTNDEGQITTTIPYGNFVIEEVKAPDGYELNTTPVNIEFDEGGTNEFTIENTKKPQVIVHHYLKTEDGEYTTEKVAEDEIIEKKDKDKYTTSPKLDLEKYELEKDENGEYVLPPNATGTFESGKTIEVIYYYEEKEIPLIVHHYIEGTEEKVPLKDGGVAKDITDSGKEGETYQTSAIDDSLLSDAYELVEVPSNAEGTYTAPEVEVTYYYKKVVRDVIINKYEKDGTTPIEGVEFSIASKETPEEEIGRYTTDSKGQVKLTLEAGEYIATETNAPEGYVMPEDNTTEFVVTKAEDVVTLNITNEKTKGTVIIHYYVIKEDGTTTEEKVPSKNGGVVEDVVQTGNVGDIYATKESVEVAENYKFVKTEGETSGEYIEGTIEVIYYYTLKDPIIESSVSKTTSTTVVSEINQVVPYTIEYNASITEYKGNGTVTIVDYLPYEINEELSDIAGGTYNSEEKTITWTESITNIDTYTNGAKEINITKEIELVFTNVDTTSDNIQNRIGAKINLDTTSTEEETEEGETTIPTDFKVDVAVEKIWDDAENSSHRPESVTIKLIGDGKEVAGQVVELSSANEWKHTFTNLPKYNIEGEEIEYNVVETETNAGDLEYYNTNVTELSEDIAGEKGVDKAIQVTNSYKDMSSNIESSITKEGTEEIKHSTDEVSYTINYTATVDEYIGEAEVTIVDYLPCGINEEKSDIAGGIYNAEERTITWVEEIGKINTYEEGQKEINITKEIKVVFSGLDASVNTITNRATGKISLDETEKEEITEGTKETEVNIQGNVVAKYLEEGTNKVLAQEETQEGKVGTDYATVQKEITGYNFIRTEGEATGKYIEGTTEVIYYYQIKDPIIESSVSKTTETQVVTVKDQAIPYTINYVATVTDYRGNGTVTIVDYLPYEINEELSNIAGGVYDAEAKTITWTEEITDIDTYTNGAKEINITKEIELVFTNVDTTADNIQNRIGAKINLDTTSTEEETEEGETTIPTDFKVDVAVEKIWDDAENSSHRPESVTIKLIGDGKEVAGQVVELSSANEWKHTFTNLPKYNIEGEEIEYNVVETETNAGDLEYYNTNVTELSEDIAGEKGVDKAIQVTNSYKDMSSNIESSITKEGTEEIKHSTDEVSYTINYTATVDEYIGEAEVTIVDYLPCGINEEKSDIAGGIYNAEERTITWVEEIGKINTYEEGQKEINITKEIKVVFSGLDASVATITNRATGKLNLKETEKEESTEGTKETEVNIQGNVVTKYLEEGTEKELSGELERTGKVGTEYTTTQKEITGYDFVRVEGEPTGKYIEGTIEVIYYYTLKDPIIDDEIEKTSSTLEITNKDQAIPYTIEYNTTITDYRGNATVTIVDYLPYEIDEGLSNISGGIYNRIEKTITWTEEITDIDTYENKSNNINITKEIELVYVNMDVTQETVENRATGTIGLDTPEKEETTEENEIIPTNFKIEVPVEKVWNDNEDTKGRRPESVTIQLTADGSEELNGEKLESVVLNEENNWKYTFENLAKYTEYGREIVYSVVEKETNEGDLEYYKEAVIENIGATIRVTNSYNLMETDLTSSIEKTGTEKITSSKDKVSYSIKYNAEITDYIGEAVVTIVDYLPYHIDEEAEGTELDGGIYDEDANTITWTINIDHINTTRDGAYKVDEQRDITIVFSDLDASQKVMVNRVKGTIDLYETEQTNKVEDTYETEIEIPGKVIVKYVDKETGEEIPFREQDINSPEAETPEGGESDEETYGYTIKGLVGDAYTTKQKEIYGYTYVENSGNTEGTMTEKDIVVTYYYEKTEAGKVTAIYIDEETGEEITYIEENEETGETEEKTYKEEIEGYIGDKYETEQKEIPNYDFVRVEGEPEGELTEEEKTVVYIYRKILAKVIVRYLEKDNTPEDDTDNKVLAEEEVINGHSGDEYKTERKEIEYYKKADPEPENAEGTMTREDIIVTYYYEKIPSGTVTAIYVDEATGKEITYIEENKETGKTEEKTYKETYKGYCGEEYKTEAKEIPYYEYIKEKAPENAQGIYTEEDVTVTYYYRQLPFNMTVDKNLIKIELNGEEQKVKNGKINKVEIPVDRVGDSTLKLEYSIVVTNTGKVEGTTEVIESLPTYFKVTEGTSKEWKKQKDGTLKLATKEIKPGETKEYKVVLEWERGANNFGTLANTVELTNVENPANFKETTIEDNKSKSELVLAVKSGEDRSMRWVGSTIGILLILAGMVVYVRRKI